MSDSVPPFLAEFNKVVEECALFRYITRDNELQKEACTKLQNLLVLVAAQKELAKASSDENYANVLLGCECVTQCLVSEIEMCLLLKQGQPDAAWGRLVDAQSAVLGAMRAHEGFSHLDENLRRLDAIEHLIFPPQLFFSSGIIVKSQLCSICGQDYEDCEHVKGRPYMGTFCTVRLIPDAVDHVAIVNNPADKRCRIEKFSAEGGYRNRMTWGVEPSDNTSKKSESFTVQGIIAVSAPPEKDKAHDITFVE